MRLLSPLGVHLSGFDAIIPLRAEKSGVILNCVL